MSNVTTEIALLSPADDLPALFASSETVEAKVAEIEAKVAAYVPDLSTSTGRKDIASFAYKVSRSKTAIDDAGKSLTEKMRSQIGAIDAMRKTARDRLDAARDRARKPLDDWEAAEEARVEALQDRLSAIDGGRADALCPSSQIKSVLAEIEAIEIGDDWQEFQGAAAIAKDKAANSLRASLAVAEKREADAEALEALRREKAARDEADRLAAEAAAEVERQRIAAEQAEARRVADEKAEAERQARVEREKQEAADRARREAQEAAERAVREANDRAAAAERQALEREEKARREAEEAEARAKQREMEAAEKERQRAAREQREAEEARAAREANSNLRAAAKAEMVAAIVPSLVGKTKGEVAAALADALMTGAIPHMVFRA